MNINNITSLNLNKNTILKSQKKNTNYSINSIESCDFKTVTYLKDYYLNQISFGKQLRANELIDRIGEGNFPSPEIVEKLRELGISRDYSLYDIHREHYKGLLECQTLDEAKEKYPEFQDVIDAKSFNIKLLNQQSTLYKILKGEIPGIDIDNFTLKILKKYYGKLKSTNDKKEYWGITSRTIVKLLTTLNIRILDSKYAAILAHQTSEFRAKQSQATCKQWQDLEYRNKQLQIRSTDEHKAKKSNSAIINWQDPNSIYNSEEFREKMSQAKTKNWQDLEYRNMQLQIRNTDEYKAKISQISTKLWQNPEYREIHSLLQLAKWQDPNSIYNSEEVKIKQSQSAIARWQDSEYREKMQIIFEAKSEAYKRHPEITSMMSKVAQQFPRLSMLLEKKENGAEITQVQKAYIRAYFKECQRIMPGYSKIIGKEQHKILVEWGVMEE